METFFKTYEKYNLTNRNADGAIFISKTILQDKRLKANDKIYCALYCQHNKNEYLADAEMGKLLDRDSVNKIKRKLIKIGVLPYMRVVSYEKAKEMVLNLKKTGYKCDWCGHKTIAIQKHHYPIPKKLGGTKTVNICPNCHYEFHLLVETERST